MPSEPLTASSPTLISRAEAASISAWPLSFKFCEARACNRGSLGGQASDCLGHENGEWRNSRLIRVQSKPIAKIGEERQPELAAGLRKPQHHIPGQAAIGAHRAAR